MKVALTLLPWMVAYCVSPNWLYRTCSLESGDPRSNQTRIPTLVSLSIQGSELTAEGQTPTGGFRKPQLRRIPGTGITDTRSYEFVVEPPPPGSMAVQVISTHVARIRLDDAGIRHVRVLGAHGALCADRY